MLKLKNEVLIWNNPMKTPQGNYPLLELKEKAMSEVYNLVYSIVQYKCTEEGIQRFEDELEKQENQLEKHARLTRWGNKEKQENFIRESLEYMLKPALRDLWIHGNSPHPSTYIDAWIDDLNRKYRKKLKKHLDNFNIQVPEELLNYSNDLHV